MKLPQSLLSERYGPVLMLLLAATFWGIVWFPLRLLYSAGLGGAWQVLVCYSAAITLLLLVAKPGFHGIWDQPWKLALLALAAGWTNLGFVLAMLEGTVVRALLLFYLSPVWTIILGHYFLGERVTRISLWTMPVALAGSILMIWEPGLEWIWPPHIADILALTAGFAFAVTNVLTRDLQKLGTRQKTLVSWVGVVALSAVAIGFYSPEIPEVSVLVWGGAVLLGLGGFFLTTLAVVYGISRMPVQQSAVILLFEIIVGGVSAWLIVGETMDVEEWIGGFLILSAGFVAAVKGHQD